VSELCLHLANAAGLMSRVFVLCSAFPAVGRALLVQAMHVRVAGGPGMVKAAYESGHPSIGVGAGNTPAVIDETADIPMAVSSILISKTFDNGVICASEQNIVAHEAVSVSLAPGSHADSLHGWLRSGVSRPVCWHVLSVLFLSCDAPAGV
jgi:acyl-CoA reductase-like NAD-dependent aldehyde dehydrogenase